jgi:arylsulfatase
MSTTSTVLFRNFGTLLATVGIVMLANTAFAQSPASPATGGLLSLPRPDFRFQGQVGRTYQDSDPATFPQIVRPPKGAPNIVLILLDDVGFGQFSVFGGGVSSPNMEKLAAQGLRYNRFHTTALCSPTRR